MKPSVAGTGSLVGDPALLPPGIDAYAARPGALDGEDVNAVLAAIQQAKGVTGQRGVDPKTAIGYRARLSQVQQVEVRATAASSVRRAGKGQMPPQLYVVPDLPVVAPAVVAGARADTCRMDG